ncbi:MAG: hypothetical protein WCQ65_11905 [Fermentimonas sp.]|jgi:predicted transcriptional regulator|nr:hypothetical protein [Acholeplasmataceae bacterium]MDY3203023.1 hypothetical protein [Methanocorpusculum sp.]
MVEINDELIEYMMIFKKEFHDIVPMRQISTAVTNEQLIDAIKKSLVAKKNLLPEIFGYSESNDKTY